MTEQDEPEGEVGDDDAFQDDLESVVGEEAQKFSSEQVGGEELEQRDEPWEAHAAAILEEGLAELEAAAAAGWPCGRSATTSF